MDTDIFEKFIETLFYVYLEMFDFGFAESEAELCLSVDDLPAGKDGLTTMYVNADLNEWTITITISKSLFGAALTRESLVEIGQVMLHEICHADCMATCRIDKFEDNGEMEHGKEFIDEAESHGLQVIFDENGDYLTTELKLETAAALIIKFFA